MTWSLVVLFLMGQCSAVVCQLYQYHYINVNKTWTEAQQYCREKHTDLATVANMTDMKRLLSNSAGDVREAWIGLYDPTNVNRTWYWSLPGEEFNESETNWGIGESNDTGNENCGSLSKNFKWSYVRCTDKKYFLCYDETNKTQKYHLIREKKTWQKAQSYCRENHTDLVSGLKQLQDGELEKAVNFTESKPYFGLFGDTWRWSDGSIFSFRQWNNELNNIQYNSGLCAMTVFDDEGRWKKENCAVRKPFICYDDKVILIKEKMNWRDAVSYCRDHHHDLVTITNLDEQRWVQEKAKKAFTDYIWMGLRYNCLKDMWFWVCNNSSTEGQMNDCDMSAAMEKGGQHRWFQGNDTEELNFICSKF